MGQQATQGGRSQWLQRSVRISIVRVGNLPFTSVVIQSRLKPSGTWFSVLQAITQSMQPTQRRVSITMPKRAISDPLSGRRLEGDEVDVHRRATHQRVDRVAVMSCASEAPLPRARFSPLAV